MPDKKIALVVVVYGKTLEQSLTIKDLVNFKYSLDYLLIVNNGPNYIIDDEMIKKLHQVHHRVDLKNELQNKPLSWIYNDFIQDYNADYYVLFDDDTEINEQYQDVLFNLKDIDVELPKIRSIIDGIIYYPRIDGKILDEKQKNITSENIYSIGSGLIISKNIKYFFGEKQKEVFDSHYAFYGVDTAFFRNLNACSKKGDIFLISSTSYLNHALSISEEEMPYWREKEYLYDNILTMRHYSKNAFKRNTKFIKLVVKKLIKFKFKEALLIIRTFLKGKHPRCE